MGDLFLTANDRVTAPCDYCGDPAWLYEDGVPHTDPFGDRPCCRPCFDQIVGGDPTPEEA